MKILVKSPSVRRDEFSKDDGTVSVRFKQSVALDHGGDFPLPFDVEVKNENNYYAPGEYTLSPDSFRVGRFGGLEINPFQLKLLPLTKLKAAASG